jgi:GNAT superfamily N-acetyltransferase
MRTWRDREWRAVPRLIIRPSMTINIRPSRPADAVLLPAVERSAGEAFRRIPSLAWAADMDDQPVEIHLAHIAAGTSWVATEESGAIVGFVFVGTFGGDLHIDELAVRYEWQGMGYGRALLNEVFAWARTHGLTGATLTTFRDVPWNAPFYRRMGFRVLADHEIGERLERELQTEAKHGLPRELRCAMRFDFR